MSRGNKASVMRVNFIIEMKERSKRGYLQQVYTVHYSYDTKRQKSRWFALEKSGGLFAIVIMSLKVVPQI